MIIEKHTVNSKDKKNFLKGRTKCWVWTRVMGYHRPISQFNVGKKSEHYLRQYFEEQKTINSLFCEKI